MPDTIKAAKPISLKKNVPVIKEKTTPKPIWIINILKKANNPRQIVIRISAPSIDFVYVQISCPS
jgi:hypothetical protein